MDVPHAIKYLKTIGNPLGSETCQAVYAMLCSHAELLAACLMEEIDFIESANFLEAHGWDGVSDAMEFIDEYRRAAIAKAGGKVTESAPSVNPD